MNEADLRLHCLGGLLLIVSGVADAQQRDLAPLPREAPAPIDNSTTAAKAELGKLLFFDERLSGENRMSCATCHIPEKAFADGLARSLGAGGEPLARNTQTVLNTAFFSTFFWDGRAASLEEQALAPVESAEEMAQDLDELVEELAAVPDYVERFAKVFSGPVSKEGIAKALAAYQRTLLTPDSPFDRYLAGDEDTLSTAAKDGLELFRGAAGCVRCHNGPLLSDGKYYRLGIGGDDLGRAAVTGAEEDRYSFRTPTLRSIAETGPYMHDGSIATLFDVVEFYYRRVRPRGPEGLPLDVEPLLGQSYSEIDALVAFLRSLSGEVAKRSDPRL